MRRGGAEIFFKEGVWQYAAGEYENAAVLLEKAGNKGAAMHARLRAIEITGKQLGSDALSESGQRG